MDRRVVLTSARPLEEAEARRALAAAGAGEPRRLGESAVEAELPAPDALRRLSAAREALAESPVDANLVGAGPNRRKRLLIADMDSTIIGVECVDEIAAAAGVGARVAEITERAMRGELEFEGALRERVALLEGLELAALEDVYAGKVRLNPGAATLIRTMAATGAETALVSGGFTWFAERVAAAAGFASFRANVLEVADGRLTGRVTPPILGREAKVERLNELARARALTPADAAAVGDGANDLGMIEAAGLGVAYRAKPKVAEAADARLDHSDLSAVLHLLGVPEAEWVRA